MPNFGTNLLYVPLQFDNDTFKALIDTGAFSSAISRNLVQKFKSCSPESIEVLDTSYPTKVRVADGQINVCGKAEFCIQLGLNHYKEDFLILEQMSSPILGNRFFVKIDIIIHPSKKLLKFPDFALRINSLNSRNKNLSQKNLVLETISKTVLKSNQQEIIEVQLAKPDISYKLRYGSIDPSILIEKKKSLCLMSSMNRLAVGTAVGVINLNPYPVTISAKTRIAKFVIMTPTQASNINSIHPCLLSSITDSLSEYDFRKQKSSVMQQNWMPRDKFWLPTPENCLNGENLQGVWKTIYYTLKKLKQQEQLDATMDAENRNKSLSKFYWNESQVRQDEKMIMENLLVQFHDIFARQRPDLGKNTDCLVKLTPEHDRPVYSKNPATPIHLRDELLVELVLIECYDIITTLPFSKYSSPTFAQRKSSGKLRILIDFS